MRLRLAVVERATVRSPSAAAPRPFAGHAQSAGRFRVGRVCGEARQVSSPQPPLPFSWLALRGCYAVASHSVQTVRVCVLVGHPATLKRKPPCQPTRAAARSGWRESGCPDPTARQCPPAGSQTRQPSRAPSRPDPPAAKKSVGLAGDTERTSENER
jgi:hypothetical protein